MKFYDHISVYHGVLDNDSTFVLTVSDNSKHGTDVMIIYPLCISNITEVKGTTAHEISITFLGLILFLPHHHK